MNQLSSRSNVIIMLIIGGLYMVVVSGGGARLLDVFTRLVKLVVAGLVHFNSYQRRSPVLARSVEQTFLYLLG